MKGYIMENENNKAALILTIKNLYKEINKISNTYLHYDDLNVSQRLILEELLHQTLTVPQIAKSHNVSRQHIQTNVNALLKKELIKSKENSNHKRSRLMELTSKGKQLFTEIEDFEQRFIADLLSEITQKEITITTQSLQSMFLKAQAISEAIK